MSALVHFDKLNNLMFNRVTELGLRFTYIDDNIVSHDEIAHVDFLIIHGP